MRAERNVPKYECPHETKKNTGWESAIGIKIFEFNGTFGW